MIDSLDSKRATTTTDAIKAIAEVMRRFETHLDEICTTYMQQFHGAMPEPHREQDRRQFFRESKLLAQFLRDLASDKLAYPTRAVKLLCPDQHFVAAIAYAPSRETFEEAKDSLKLHTDWFNTLLTCKVCGSSDLHFEDSPNL